MKKIPADKKFLNNIQVIDIAEEGKGVGKSDDLVIFIDKAVPGDVVDVELLRRKKKFYEGKIQKIVKPSEHRTDPFCEHFGVCGGCKWQHLNYDAQLLFKQKSVVDALQRLAKVDTSGIEPILGSKETSYYRNKLEYTFSDKRWLTDGDMRSDEEMEMNALGYHIPGRFDKILDIQHCYLQADPSNDIRNKVREYALANKISFYNLKNHEGSLRNLIIRTSSTGELMVIVVFAYVEEEQIAGMMKFISNEFKSLKSLLYIINQKKNDTIFDQDIHVFEGADHIFENMNGLKFKIGPKSFYQTNSDQAFELYKITKDFAGFKGDELVYDLYTGAGTIANFIAGSVRSVVGIEYVPTAIEDAKINSEINSIKNTSFFAGDMKDILNAEFINTHGKPDVVITDPPRAGMHADVVKRLLEMEAEKIVYVSCNAATQARDIALMKDKYEVSRIRPVDMFPHTQHVENVVLLTLNLNQVKTTETAE
ncbi:23S rRNA (uracil1939-C5)-methyltransferase [Daejeonella rubra]|uniref:23S rRNA (Uracil1939-C5)-methyltransferase n=1 Tax=Daejeonella rubra TaxID=990371 RepID=A0A1G9SXK9_9SPHI|nr:23S rRNA (uracil(1939)-C(5))-methyltransferase RlmD [Daejeonella rubra]SDM40142.1 23S rRNA (uracil1939-C5)-methyltransferase [Daejeonella rubra]